MDPIQHELVVAGIRQCAGCTWRAGRIARFCSPSLQLRKERRRPWRSTRQETYQRVRPERLTLRLGAGTEFLSQHVGVGSDAGIEERPELGDRRKHLNEIVERGI